ncbi:fumarylacetoacetate hydrolase family protein [Streptomyces sp. NPDC059477]|uniref:fumarylacetoacetate hydrolase family protein n=1 Tax=Streptomyces sp. NPDC059477 TaxID=3346847 RepID=UPI003696DDFB
MKLVGYVNGQGESAIGSLGDADTIVPLATMREFYQDGFRIAERAAPAGEPIKRSGLTLLPVVPETARVFCVAINYLGHAAEAEEVGIARPVVPMIFGRWASTLVVDGASIPVPPREEGLDWEVELAAVIGRPTYDVDEATAMESILGYAVFNDISARQVQLETPQFTLGKNADRSGPIGPLVIDPTLDPHDLNLRTRVNGETVQQGNTRDMVFKLPQVISHISRSVTLLPGDVIATGTPEGIGASMKPPRLMGPGDVVEVEVEKLGVVRNTITKPGSH